MNEAEVAGGPEANGAPPAEDAREVVRRALAADRAEARAQLEMALGMLASVTPAAEPAPAPPEVAVKAEPEPDPAAADALRQAATAAQEAAALVTKSEVRLAGLQPVDEGLLRAAVTAAADAEEAREEIGPAWRRAAGALISATGMAIIIASMAWPPWGYLVPTVLVLVMAADLRMAAAAARVASLRSAEAMAAAGVASVEGVECARAAERERQAAAARLEEARLMAAEATAHWELLAPGTAPADIELLISALPRPSPGAVPAASPAPAPEPVELTPAQERTRALAEALAAEARREIARVDAALAELAAYDGKQNREV